MRCNHEVLREFGPHPAHVTPEKVLAAQLGRAREMVRFLIFVEVLDVIGGDIARPLHIEQVCIIRLKHSETGGLTRVHHSVINVRGVGDAERHE